MNTQDLSEGMTVMFVAKIFSLSSFIHMMKTLHLMLFVPPVTSKKNVSGYIMHNLIMSSLAIDSISTNLDDFLMDNDFLKSSISTLVEGEHSMGNVSFGVMEPFWGRPFVDVAMRPDSGSS